MLQLVRDTSHVPQAQLHVPQGGQLEMDRDLEAQSRDMTRPPCKQFLVILQVWGHCLLEKELFRTVR